MSDIEEIEDNILKNRENIKNVEKEDYINNLTEMLKEQSKEAENLREEFGIEKPTDENLKEIENYLSENYENFIPEEYLVRGATLKCSFGSHERKLDMLKDHGVYVEGFPMMHELEKELEKNIKYFGLCSSLDPLLNSTNVKLVKITYDEKGNSIEETISGAKCMPFIIGNWRDTKENLHIVDNGDKDGFDKYRDNQSESKGYNALTTKSFLICRYGGIIEPLDSGQLKLEDDVDNDKFNNIMKDNFGFDDDVSNIMFKLIKNVGSSYEFFRLMSSINYDGLIWSNVSGGEDNKKDLKKKLINYGLTDEEIDKLINEVTNQHNACGWNSIEEYLSGIFPEEYKKYKSFENFPQKQKNRYTEIYKMYNGKIDFSHMCATTSTIIKYDGIFEDLGGSIIINPFYNRVNSNLDDNAGYAGDVYGTFGAYPSMGKDDYKADLDAVNLANIVKNNKDNNIADLLYNYYSSISNGKLNRAKEFKKIQGKDKLLKEIEKGINLDNDNYKKALSEDEKLISSYSKKVMINFKYNIINDNNEFKEYAKITDEEKVALDRAHQNKESYKK